MEVFSFISLILKSWWWFILLIIFFFFLKVFYLWWVRWEVWYKKNKWILLEIKPPKEILKPFKAMEDIFTVLWGVYDSPNWRERWCEGEFPKFPYWFSCEIAGIGGKIHFFMRILEVWRDMVEATIYSHYPEAEISIVDDYTKYVPQDIPNQDWDLYGEDFSLLKDDVYPIKTYTMFFEERPEIKEEKRMDPIDSLMEALSKLQPAEQFWLQIVATPITNKDIPWVTRGKAEVKKIGGEIAKRWFPAEKKGELPEPLEVLITGKPPLPPPPTPLRPWPPGELMPAEREIIEGIENKIKKYGYKTSIRILYLYKKDEPHFDGNSKIGKAYFNHFMTENLNTLIYWGPTRTRVHYWLRERRLYLRKRRQFRRYIERLPSYFPRTMEGELPFWHLGPKGPGIRGTFVLNTEELATIYHFPAKVITPAITPVEAKKAGPPPSLPVE